MAEEKLPEIKLIAVVGPTSSGKSELAVRLARRFHGEIISADSRQVYKGMDLGTGKVPGQWLALKSGRRRLLKYSYKSVTHHLIDFANPKKQYSAALFQKQAKRTIREISRRGRLPILCGGTGHWVDAVVYDQRLPEAGPDLRLRKQLEKKSADELYARLSELDPRRAETIDSRNKRRLIRALEIVIITGKPVPRLAPLRSPYNALWIGISLPKERLYKKIDKRLKERLKAGMVDEVRKLRQGLFKTPASSFHGRKTSQNRKKEKNKDGLSWKRLESFGLEYRYISLYLQGKLPYEEMVKQLSLAIKHYAKRQMTWFKRNKNIHWTTGYSQSQKLLKNFCN